MKLAQATIRDRHPVMAMRLELSCILDILDADDAFTYAPK